MKNFKLLANYYMKLGSTQKLIFILAVLVLAIIAIELVK